jgi:hypothetical protein
VSGERGQRFAVAVVPFGDSDDGPRLFGPFFSEEQAGAEAKRFNRAHPDADVYAEVWPMGSLRALRAVRPVE